MNFHMINVGNKPITRRTAVAQGQIFLKSAYSHVRDRTLLKGDALVLAEMAGIQGAKRAYDTLPLCHPLALDHVKIISECDDQTESVKVYCIATAHAKTGVEMEALSGVQSALLSIWDLAKMVEPELEISHIKLLIKEGGKKGRWKNSCNIPLWLETEYAPPTKAVLSDRSSVILTLSDRAHRGDYEDVSGNVLRNILESHGANVVDYRVLPDDISAIRSHVEEVVRHIAPHLIMCTGGTGLAERDVTPEAISSLFTRTVPGIGELLRSDGAKYTPLAWSSRSIAGVIDKTLVVTLPGNPSAVREGMNALLPNLLPHMIQIIQGEKV